MHVQVYFTRCLCFSRCRVGRAVQVCIILDVFPRVYLYRMDPSQPLATAAEGLQDLGHDLHHG